VGEGNALRQERGLHAARPIGQARPRAKPRAPAKGRRPKPFSRADVANPGLGRLNWADSAPTDVAREGPESWRKPSFHRERERGFAVATGLVNFGPFQSGLPRLCSSELEGETGSQCRTTRARGTAADCRLRCLRWSRGALAGLFGAVFRLSFEEADRLRGARIGWAHDRDVVGFILVVAVCTGATALAA
jgi:hypothetical protein